MATKKRTLRAIDLNGSPLDQFSGNEFEIWEDTDGKVHITLDKEKDISGESIDNWNQGGGGGGTTVVANPEMAGDEPDLEGLQVGESKYKVPAVTANPEGEPTASLTKITINGVVYSLETSPADLDELMNEEF